MKPPPFLYQRAGSVAEAVDALVSAGPDAKVLAGGQSLVPLLNFRMARPTVLVDVARVPELSYVRVDDGMVAIGGATCQRVVETSEVVAAACPLVGQALGFVGHVQIRNRGTVGGSIAHADPAAELPAASIALGAELVTEGSGGRRVLAAREFFLGPFMTALEPDEVLTEVRFPHTRGAAVAFREVARRHGDFALGGVAAAVWFDGGGIVERVGIAASGMGGSPLRLERVERSIIGRALAGDAIGDAAAEASTEVEPFTDAHADEGYRRRLIATLVRRVLADLMQQEARR